MNNNRILSIILKHSVYKRSGVTSELLCIKTSIILIDNRIIIEPENTIYNLD